ncbi:MAG TPA: ATP-binding protein [Longimicrobiaceae bacterium]|nr:ATP-binding protein [Longimicrobiaceae bacterium]
MRLNHEARPAADPGAAAGPAGEAAGEPVAFVLELPSDLDVIEGAVAYLVDRCRGARFDGSRLTLNFRVGMCEALANAVIYGNRRDPGKCVRVEVELSSSRVAVCVRDQGEGFEPGEVPDPTLPENLERSGGRGIFLLHKLMDEVRYNERGNEVRFVLHCGEPLRRASGE